MNKINCALSRVSAVILAAALVFSGCQKDDINPNREYDQYLVDVTGSEAYETAEEFTDYLSTTYMLSVPETAAKIMFKLISWDDLLALSLKFYRELGKLDGGEIERYTFTYNTTDVFGRPVVLSAGLMVPNTKAHDKQHTIEGITLYNNFFAKASVTPSLMGSCMMERAAFNHAVVVPDYEGYGVDYGKHHHPYFEYAVLARQSIDCELAALELLKEIGVNVPENCPTYNIGISKGAPVALAVQRLMENSVSEKIAKKINLYDTFCSCGPYDIGPIARAYFDDPDGKPLYLSTLLVCSAYFSHPDIFKGYSPEDFFCENFNNTRVDYLGGNYSLFELAEKIIEEDYPKIIELYESQGIYTIQDVFAPSFFKEDGSVDYDCHLLNLLLEVMDKGQLSGGWSPKSGVMLMHSVNDVLADYGVFTETFNNLKYNGTDEPNPYVTKWIDYIFDHDILSGIGIVCAMLMEDPAGDKLMDLYTKFDLSFLQQ